MLQRIILLLALGLTSLAAAGEETTPCLPACNLFDRIRTDMAGTWEGELQYLDYQAGERFGIPMRVEAELLPDGVTVFRKTTFTDPGNLVHVSSLTSYAIEGIFEAYFRDRKGEFYEYQLDRIELRGPEHGVPEETRGLVMSREGTDDDRPAAVRISLFQTAGTQTVLKEVRYLDEGEQAQWFERNRTVLRRID